MATFAYTVLWLLALIAALLTGLASHYIHAHLQAYPEKVIDGYRWRDHALNEVMNEDYHWWGHYDDGGWWEFYSLRNLASHTVPLVLIALFGGLYWWDSRAEAVASVCAKASQIGYVPGICTW